MKKLAFTVALMLSILIMHGQNLKQVTKSTQFLINKYTIDKSTKSKEGLFVQLEKKTKDTICVGYYKNDKKVNIWRYYDKNNELYFSYNHDSNQIVHKSHILIQADSFFVKKESGFVLEKVDSPPIPLEGKPYIFAILAESFRLPISSVENGISGKSIYTFEIKKDGNIGNIHTEYSIDNAVDNEVERIFKQLKEKELRFSPAKIGTEVFDSEYILTVDIQTGFKPHPVSKIPYVWELTINYEKQVRTITSSRNF